MARTLPATALLIALAAASAANAANPAQIQQGRQLAQRNCGMCHAIGPSGASPNAAAPPFRELARRRYPFDWLVKDLEDGLLRNHPAMPDMRFSKSEIRTLVAYIRSIQQPADAGAPKPARP
jgi:mono/diheme cytochrome c family protein